MFDVRARLKFMGGMMSSDRAYAVIDRTGDDFVVPPLKYNITSFGADFLVDGLVRRLRDGDIYIPSFQRNFVWDYKRASRFIESLLLGLPIPGIFLSRDFDSEKMFVIDGQQRLRTLLFFYDGVFAPKKKEFALAGVQKQYEGLTYKDLNPEDRRRLNDSIIHATIVRQDSPPEDDSSIYYLFERINTGGTPLSAQEIRASIFHGPFIDLIKNLNDIPEWRHIFGPVQKRMKDQELILRFFAFLYYCSNYKRPLKEFLNKYVSINRNLEYQSAEELTHIFQKVISFIDKALGSEAFRPDKVFNAAVFDAVMVGLAKRFQINNSIFDIDSFRSLYYKLVNNEDFQDAVLRSTADEKKVKLRISMAVSCFSSLG